MEFAESEVTSIYDTIITTYKKGPWMAVLNEYDDGSAMWLKTGPDVRVNFEEGEIENLPDSTKLKAELAAWTQNQEK